jgi:hypothetical protein
VSGGPVIGFDRRIDLAWLDAVAAHVAAGHHPTTTRAKLCEMLDGQVAGGSKHGSACDKTVNVLSKTWSTVRQGLAPLRDQALELLPLLSPPERLAIHWAMLLAGYRFFGDVAENTGRLLSLQSSLTQAQLTRRMREAWGDRSTLSRATQRVVRSTVEWGVLQDTGQRGSYARESQAIAVHGELALLLVEALLHHVGRGLPMDQATGHHALFPFEVRLGAHEVRHSARLEVHRQGLDVDVVGLRCGATGDG